MDTIGRRAGAESTPSPDVSHARDSRSGARLGQLLLRHAVFIARREQSVYPVVTGAQLKLPALFGPNCVK